MSMKQTVIKNPSWWRRRTGLERTLTLTTACAAVAVVALVASLCVVLLVGKAREELAGDSMPPGPEALGSTPGVEVKPCKGVDGNLLSKKNPGVCLTPGCVHSASKVLDQMDKSVEPCDDFYRFACGTFLKETNIPDDKTAVNTFSLIGDQLQMQLRAIVEEPVVADEPQPFQKAKNLYKACMNKTLIASRGLNPLLDTLKKLGGWPVMDGEKWDEASFTWQNSVRLFRQHGFSMDYFIDFSIGTDFKNSTGRIIDLDQAALGLSREYLSKGPEDRIVKAYYAYMVDIATILGADKEVAAKELRESLNFEMKLANISLPIEKRRNATQLYNPHTIAELQDKYPSVAWVEYINALLPEGLKVDQTETVIVSVPSYLKSLEEVLSKTPKRVQANYVMWRVTAFCVFFMTEELRKRQLQYSTALSGKTEQEPRWKECVDISSGSLPIAVGALYVRKHFNERAKKVALEMVEGIKEEFQQILEKVDWMDDVTRKSAIEKARDMTTHIAYPDEILDNKKLTEFYDGLEIYGDKYMESVLNLNIFVTNYAFNKLRKPVNKTDWVTHARPAIVNAFYSSIENSIQFPAGILQGAFFAHDRPRYMNYGAIGFVIGHEITHGFDDQGRQFDKNGNLVDWWAASTREAYLGKAQCIIDQYGNFTERDVNLHLNGINTQGENIADNGGIKEAYLAYSKWVEKNGPEPRLPGLDFSPQQMFWISAANTWCSKYRPETMKMRITTGVHSPGEFRVLGPLSNMEDFARDFDCPVGSPMNPEHKCKVW